MARKGSPRNKKAIEKYKMNDRKHINAEARKERHEKRMQKFADRKANGKSYVYVKPNSEEEKLRRSNKVTNELSVRVKDYSHLKSVFAKLENELAKDKMESKNRIRTKQKGE